MALVNNSTLFVHIESGAYPLTMYSMKSRHTNISFGSEVDESVMTDLGYAVVTPTERPTGDVVTEAAPAVQEDGSYKQVFEVRAFSAEEIEAQLSQRKYEALSQISNALTQTLNVGAPVQFAGQPDVLHVQMRDGDRPNVLGLKAFAENLASQGVADAVVPFRTYEDITVMLTPAQTIELAWAVLAAFQEVMSMSWALKDEVAAAASADEVPGVSASFEVQTRTIG